MSAFKRVYNPIRLSSIQGISQDKHHCLTENTIFHTRLREECGHILLFVQFLQDHTQVTRDGLANDRPESCGLGQSLRGSALALRGVHTET